MALPKTGLSKDKLQFKNEASSSESQSSANKVSKVTFLDIDGQEKQAYFKPISENYPVLLAKFSVAASVLMRLSLGERAAEDRLVYDADGNICGTVSIALKNFKPFNFLLDGLPYDEAEKEQVCPSTGTLIQHNIMELIFFSWFLGEDDLHPNNIGLSGRLDWDMLFYPITEIIKGPRTFIGGSAEGKIELSEEDFSNLPELANTKRHTHWPTHPWPGNANYLKKFPNHDAFINLGKNDARFYDSVNDRWVSAQEQLYTAALKALLTWQPEVVKLRLQDALGDEPLNFTALPENKVKQLQDCFPEFFNLESNSASFVECMIKIYQEFYDKLYYTVTNYTADGKNNYGELRHAFYKFLLENPGAYNSIAEWVKEENKLLENKDLDILNFSGQKNWQQAASVLPMKRADPETLDDDTLLQYIEASNEETISAALQQIPEDKKNQLSKQFADLRSNKTRFNAHIIKTFLKTTNNSIIRSKIFKMIHPTTICETEFRNTQLDMSMLNKRYHKIWRDTFTPWINNVDEESRKLITKVTQELSLNNTKISLVPNQPLKKEVKDSGDLLNAQQSINKDVIKKEIDCDKESFMRSGLNQLIEGREKMITSSKTYWAIHHQELNPLKNREYINDMEIAINHFKQAISEFGPNHDYSKRASEIIQSLTILCENIDFYKHTSTSAPEEIKSQPVFSNMYYTQGHTDDEIVNCCVERLFEWINTLSLETFEKEIGAVLIEYNSGLAYYSMYRTRFEDIKNYLQHSKDTKNDQRLAHIYASAQNSGGTGALNTTLTKHFINKLITENFKNTIGSELVSVERAIKENNFNTDHYTKAIVAFTKKSERFEHIYTSSAQERIHQIIFKWAENYGYDGFVAYLNNVISGYEKHIWWSSRRPEIHGYYKNNSPQIILANIFSKRGYESNSFNPLLFKTLIKKIQAESKQNNNRKLSEQDYDLINKIKEQNIPDLLLHTKTFAKKQLEKGKQPAITHEPSMGY